VDFVEEVKKTKPARYDPVNLAVLRICHVSFLLGIIMDFLFVKTKVTFRGSMDKQAVCKVTSTKFYIL